MAIIIVVFIIAIIFLILAIILEKQKKKKILSISNIIILVLIICFIICLQIFYPKTHNKQANLLSAYECLNKVTFQKEVTAEIPALEDLQDTDPSLFIDEFWLRIFNTKTATT